jgi:hypothetical protein
VEFDNRLRLPGRSGRAARSLSFLKVPEPKLVKNRLHLDVHVGGGRDDMPWEIRWPRVLAAADASWPAAGSAGCPQPHRQFAVLLAQAYVEIGRCHRVLRPGNGIGRPGPAALAIIARVGRG